MILEIFEAPKDLLSCQTLAKHRAGFHRKEHSHNRNYKSFSLFPLENLIYRNYAGGQRVLKVVQYPLM